jgi:4-amino-4-deoxy-L-arabinose transferase-like glycosyltransferase
MLDSGNYVDIRFGQVPRYKKPVGIYWLQAATTAIAGPLNGDQGDHSRIWTYRLPSLLGGIAAVWATIWCGALFSAEAGLLAGLLMAVSLLLTAEATIATTDAVLLAATTVMQGVLLRLYRAAREELPPPSRRLVLCGWAALAVGIMLKGPVTPAVAAVTIIALIALDSFSQSPRRLEWRWLSGSRPLMGIGLTILVTAPWLVAIALESHGAFFEQSLGQDFAAKVAGGQESHGAPPGYFLLLSAITFWPAILFAAPGIGVGVARRGEPAIRFLLAWAGATWVMMEAVPTKLPHYVLPAYPALAILAALWLLETAPATGWRRYLPLAAAVQFVAGLGVAVAACILLPQYYADAPASWPILAAAGVTALFGLAALILMLVGRRLIALILALAAAVTIVPALTSGIGPSLNQLWVSERLAALVAKDRQPFDPPPMLAGYEEPSLVFALGADVALTDGKGAAELGAQKGGLALVDDGERPNFLARLAELQATASPLDDLSGFNYSRGRSTHVTLYRVAPLQPVTHPLTH